MVAGVRGMMSAYDSRMRVLVLGLLLAGCRPPPPACPTCPTPAPSPAPVASVPPPTAIALDDAAVISRSEAFLVAVDRAEVAGFDASTSEGFMSFAFGRTSNVKWLRAGLENRAARKLPPRTRTCTGPRVQRGPSSAVYVAMCTERYPAHDDIPGHEVDTWNIVVHALHGTEWRIVQWTTQLAGLETERGMWDEVYRQSINFKRTANQHLIDSVKGKKPGTALDLAMGQGRNVLYLASQGWKVTGVDISEEGIRLAKAAAAKQKLTFDAVVKDMDKYDFGVARWDLVTLIYAGADLAQIERIKPSIKKGGLFVVEFFHRDATAGSGIGGFETGALAKLFDGWTIVKDEVVEDIADWSLRKSKLVRFTAQKK